MKTSSPSRNTSVRKPSHFGSKIQPSPGGRSPTRFASIGRTGGFTGSCTLRAPGQKIRKRGIPRGVCAIPREHRRCRRAVQPVEPASPHSRNRLLRATLPKMSRREEALEYHRRGRPGKIAVVPTKPLTNQRDLALAYSPGVAEPCLEIKQNPDDAYRYTAKGNLVAVVTNGTAVLGLGNIGALAGKPVMEGKGNLLKQFADLDVFDLEVGSEDPQDVIRFCQLLEPTVGGINLEDIRAPDCFPIEETLRKTLTIPVFHDDQHGTAIISGAALRNAVGIVEKDLSQIRGGVSGAGAAAIATAEHYVRLGVTRENIILCDRQGVVRANRKAKDMDA